MKTIKNLSVGKLNVRVFCDRQAMGSCAGTEAAQRMKELLQEQKSINVMFAAAPSQNEVLTTLLADKDIDWLRINAFHMDEYVGLAANHPAGFRNFLRRALFDRVNFKSVNLINGNAADAEQEAQRYAALLEENPLDICIMGVGENGHVAFNDPPVADFDDPVLVKVVELEHRCRMQQVNDGCFAALSAVPTHALTVTIPGLVHAKELFCVVPALTKAEAIQAMLSGKIATACPASILTSHTCAKLYLDSDSAKYIL